MPRQQRLSWVEAVERAIEQEKRPLYPEEIASIALQNAWVRSGTALPEDSVTGAVWKHMKQAGNPLGFVKLPGRGRKELIWLQRIGPAPVSE